MAEIDVSRVSISSIGRRLLSGSSTGATQRRRLGVAATLTMQSSESFNERLLDETAESFAQKLQAEAPNVAAQEIAEALNLDVDIDTVQNSIVTAEALQQMEAAAEMYVLYPLTWSTDVRLVWPLLSARLVHTGREAPPSKLRPCLPIQAKAPRT